MYIVVKDFNKQGCICHLLDDDNVKVSLPDMLESVLDIDRLQVVCLGNLTCMENMLLIDSLMI